MDRFIPCHPLIEQQVFGGCVATAACSISSDRKTHDAIDEKIRMVMCSGASSFVFSVALMKNATAFRGARPLSILIELRLSRQHISPADGLCLDEFLPLLGNMTLQRFDHFGVLRNACQVPPFLGVLSQIV
jgi:hypothetical protein